MIFFLNKNIVCLVIDKIIIAILKQFKIMCLRIGENYHRILQYHSFNNNRVSMTNIGNLYEITYKKMIKHIFA